MAFGYQESAYEVLARHERPVLQSDEHQYWKIELREKESPSEEWLKEIEAFKQHLIQSGREHELNVDKTILRYISLDRMSSDHKQLHNTLLKYEDIEALEADWQTIIRDQPLAFDDLCFSERIEGLGTGYTKDGCVRMY